MDVRTELKIFTRGVIQRQREAALRRAKARRRLRRQQAARRVVRYAVGSAAVGAAGYGASKSVSRLGDLKEAKARLARRNSRSENAVPAQSRDDSMSADNFTAPV